MPEMTVEEVWGIFINAKWDAERNGEQSQKEVQVMRLCIGYVEMRAEEEGRDLYLRKNRNALSNQILEKPWQSLLTKLKGGVKE